MMLTLFPLLLTMGFLVPSINAVSVCDELDVVFLIDAASIIHNEANIIGLMDSIIVNGSSEFSGFSAVSYGHHLPLTADSVLFHLDDTKHIAHRRETQKVVHEKVATAFQTIKGAVSDKPGHTVSVLDALKYAQSQHSPVAMKRKQELLGEPLDYSMGHHDDDTIYIVFDWTNQLMTTHDICKMYEMVDAPGISDHFYFLFGQDLDESIGVNCHREGGGILKYGESFRHFDETAFTESPEEIDTIYNLTCPAYVDSPQYNGQGEPIEDHTSRRRLWMMERRSRGRTGRRRRRPRRRPKRRPRRIKKRPRKKAIHVPNVHFHLNLKQLQDGVEELKKIKEQLQEEHTGESVSCGHHEALSCDLCPLNGDKYMGALWCNGDCEWSNDECVDAA